MKQFPNFGIVLTVAILVPVMGGGAFAGDEVARGEQLFKKNCNTCHALPAENKNAFGPSLHHVVGRHAGIASGYSYSSAMHDSRITWTEQELDGYLKSPKKFVGPVGYRPNPEIKMTFSGLKDDAERKAVIAYLKVN